MIFSIVCNRMHLIYFIACARIFFLAETLVNPFGVDAPIQQKDFADLLAGNMISSSILSTAVNHFAFHVIEALEIKGLPGFHIFSPQESKAALDSFDSPSAVVAPFLLVSPHPNSHVGNTMMFSHRFIHQCAIPLFSSLHSPCILCVHSSSLHKI